MSTWVQTRSNKVFDLASPTASAVELTDIAFSLSRLARYNGHTREFYSVAQHSVLVSVAVEGELRQRRGSVLYARSDMREIARVALWGLMHDAAEAYIGDVVSPVKQLLRLRGLTGFDELETRVMDCVIQKFDLSSTTPEIVWEYDLRLLATERRDLFGPCTRNWRLSSEPLSEKIEPWTMDESEARFLERYTDLRREC